MGTETYAMVRGRVIRVTELGQCGSIQDGPIRYGVSKCVAKVGVGEIVEAGDNEILRNSDDAPALHFVRDPLVIGHNVTIDFIKVDPGILSLVAGVEPVYDWAVTDIIGFDAKLRMPATAFGLEVWSKLASQQPCATEDGPGFGEDEFGEGPFGGAGSTRRWGYTIFPYIKGGYISDFEFGNGTVTFKIVGAQTRMGAKWYSGPYALTDETARQPSPVSGNTSWRNFIYAGSPPEPTDGLVEFNDVIDGGTATVTTSDILDGEFVVTSSDTIEGGNAA
jgi:hypothetical protein